VGIMCDLCEKYGEKGKPWYLNPRYYARPLYKKMEKEEEHPMVLDELRYSTDIIKPIIDMKEKDSKAYQDLLEIFSEQSYERAVGQVVSLEDAKKMVEIAQPVARIDCICRRTVRATFEDGEKRPRSCLGIGVGMFRWKEWPERYKGGVEFISTEEAKKHLEHWYKRGMVITIMTFGTPYIGGICLCDYPDCMLIRMRVNYGTKNLLKGHQVARVEYDKCIGCGTCAARCQFGAIKMEVTTNKSNIDMTKCFGCGVCAYACLQEAITLLDRKDLPALRDEW
jgi:ferredoxin